MCIKLSRRPSASSERFSRHRRRRPTSTNMVLLQVVLWANKDHAQLDRARHPVKLRVSGGPPNYRQSLLHQIRSWHGCQTRQVEPSTILVLVETARRGSCSRLRGNVGIFGAHELPGGVAKAVMIHPPHASGPLGIYLTEELGNNRACALPSCETIRLSKALQYCQHLAGECWPNRPKLASYWPLLPRQQMTT
jgi:hypothetical protein